MSLVENGIDKIRMVFIVANKPQEGFEDIHMRYLLTVRATPNVNWLTR